MTDGAGRSQGGDLLPFETPPKSDAIFSTELLVEVNAIWILSAKYECLSALLLKCTHH